MEILLTVNRPQVLAEVAQSTSYSGAKMTGDDSAFGRIPTIDQDEPELLRFWDECRAEVAKEFMRILASELMDGSDYKLTLNLSSAFDTSLQPSMQLALFSYFVQAIAARWFVYTNKGEAADTSLRASALLQEVKQKAYYKKPPTRPSYTTNLAAGTSITLPTGATYDTAGTATTVTTATTATLAANSTATLTTTANQVKLPAGTVLTLSDNSTATLTTDTFVMRTV